MFYKYTYICPDSIPQILNKSMLGQKQTIPHMKACFPWFCTSRNILIYFFIHNFIILFLLEFLHVIHLYFSSKLQNVAYQITDFCVQFDLAQNSKNEIYENVCDWLTETRIKKKKLTKSWSVAPNHQFVDVPRLVASSTKKFWVSSFRTSARYPPMAWQYPIASSQVFASASVAK